MLLPYILPKVITLKDTLFHLEPIQRLLHLEPVITLGPKVITGTLLGHVLHLGTFVRAQPASRAVP